MTLADLFPDQDYRFQLRFERSEPAEFFAPAARHEELIAQRRSWLRTEPQTYAALLSPGEALLEEAVELAGKWNDFVPPNPATPWQKCLALGECWETDYLLLKSDEEQKIRLYGGCLCFPSSWRLSEKVGQPMEFIHAPVPGLNASIGAGIHKFLTNLKPGVASLRHNWGLSRSPEMNHHPDRSLPRLDERVGVEDVWLRVEHQALVALPKSGGILFGIRVVNHPLTDVKADSVAASRLCHALATMPEEMARYKGLAAARGRIVELLRST